MNPCDNPEMDTRKYHFAIGVSILLLALAVFGWGLHSKLSLYKLRARASETLPVAKLLSERERPTDIAQHCDLNHGDLHAVALAAGRLQQVTHRGFRVELYHSDTKIKKQLAYAEKKGIPYVWFPPFKDGQPHEIKNMANGEQAQADPASWSEKK